MKVIIAGCRNWSASRQRIDEVVRESGFDVTEVVSGNASGIDESGEAWADDYAGIPIKTFPADWAKHGKAAGPIRNKEMSEYADALIAFWDGKSRGTLNMINQMRRLGKPYHVVPLGNVVLHDLHKDVKK